MRGTSQREGHLRGLPEVVAVDPVRAPHGLDDVALGARVRDSTRDVWEAQRHGDLDRGGAGVGPEPADEAVRLGLSHSAPPRRARSRWLRRIGAEPRVLRSAPPARTLPRQSLDEYQ